MKKKSCNILFDENKAQVIHETIKNEVEYLCKRSTKKFDRKTKASIVERTTEQFVSHVNSLSEDRYPWTMEHKVIPISVLISEKNLMADIGEMVFTRQRKDWVATLDAPSKKSYSFNEFEAEVFSDLITAASTAAFYAVKSYTANSGGF